MSVYVLAQREAADKEAAMWIQAGLQSTACWCKPLYFSDV